MFIRCAKCKSSTRVPLGHSELKLRCVNCGTTSSLANVGALGNTPNERFAKAEAYSQRHDIDLASAYSVLMGLMQLDDTEKLTPQRIARLSKSGSTGKDLVFRASKVAHSHKIPMRLAFEVAEGKMPLDEALRRARAGEGGPVRIPVGEAPPPDRGAKIAAVAAGVAIGLTLLFLSTRSEESGQSARVDPQLTERQRVRNAPSPVIVATKQTVQAPAPDAATATKDGEGRVTFLRGRSPEAVLEAFCAAQQRFEPCEPGGIQPAIPARRGVRLGLVKSPLLDPMRRHAIWIRLDPETREWFAGTGLKPLTAEPI